jgi:hypothetical protein
MKTPVIVLPNLLLWAAVAICPAQVSRSVPKAEMTRQLEEIARVATIMVDGDVCRRITTKRALEFMVKVDPRDRALPGDNFDVNDEPYIQTKKTLIRLSRLASFPCDANLWMPLEGAPGKIQILIRNVHEMSQFWRGGVSQDTAPQMKTVLETGKRITVTDRPGWIAVLAPVYDSLGDIAGLVEVVSQERLNPQENVR